MPGMQVWGHDCCIHVCAAASIRPPQVDQPFVACSYVWKDGQFWQVPASRAEVFKDSTLRPPEKRLLMRFLQKLQQYAARETGEVSSSNGLLKTYSRCVMSCRATTVSLTREAFLPSSGCQNHKCLTLHCRLGRILMGRGLQRQIFETQQVDISCKNHNCLW